MKKLAIILSLAAVAATSYGQGYVTVAGTEQNSTNTTLLTSGYTGGSANGSGTFGAIGGTGTGQAYLVALLTTTASSPSTAFYGNANAVGAWTNTGTLGANNTFAGRLTIGSDYATSQGAAAVGTTQDWLLLAWSANEGSLATVLANLANGGGWAAAGYVGWSVIGTGAAGAAPSALPLTIEGTASPIITTGFTLDTVPVPEPATMALAAISGASLLLFRRKK